MKYFRILCADDNIDADRPYAFHNSTCPSCGYQGRVLGFDYPMIDLAAIFSKDELCNYFIGQAFNPVDWSFLVGSQERIRARFGSELELPMVCGFGQLKGKITGRLLDFEGLPDSTICCQVNMANTLINDGLKDLVCFDTCLRGKKNETFVELIIPKQAEADPSFFIKRCAICLKSQGDIKKLRIAKASLNNELNLIRVRGLPSIVLASEKFKAIYDNRKCTGVKFFPIELY